MPVQFLSGGGGSTGDIRSVIATPVLTNIAPSGSSVEQTIVKWTLAANSLEAKSSLSFKTMGRMPVVDTTSTSIIFYVRIGTTGTTSDTLLFQTAPVSGASVANRFYTFDGKLYIETIGSTGSCFCGGIVFCPNGLFEVATTGGTPTSKTINTTSTLYLTVSANITTGSTNGYESLGASINLAFQ